MHHFPWFIGLDALLLNRGIKGLKFLAKEKQMFAYPQISRLPVLCHVALFGDIFFLMATSLPPACKIQHRGKQPVTGVNAFFWHGWGRKFSDESDYWVYILMEISDGIFPVIPAAEANWLLEMAFLEEFPVLFKYWDSIKVIMDIIISAWRG